MTNSQEKRSKSTKQWKGFGLIFAKAEQKLLAGFIIVSLIGIGIWSWRHAARVHRVIDIDQRSQQAAAFQIDLNRASWQDISNLPGIGDRLAHDIVAYRDEIGSFASNEAIQSVSGIGPLKYQQIAPFLTAISTDSATMAAAESAANRR